MSTSSPGSSLHHPKRLDKFKLNLVMMTEPVTVAERPKSCTVFARSKVGIVGSNSTKGMDV
jgi:hypothetical protein